MGSSHFRRLDPFFSKPTKHRSNQEDLTPCLVNDLFILIPKYSMEFILKRKVNQHSH